MLIVEIKDKEKLSLKPTRILPSKSEMVECENKLINLLSLAKLETVPKGLRGHQEETGIKLLLNLIQKSALFGNVPVLLEKTRDSLTNCW